MKTVVTDLDGTLLFNGQLSEETIQICQAFQKENRLILATGRNLESTRRIYEALKMEQYQSGGLILLNGLAFYDFKDQEYRCLEAFDRKTAKKIVRIAYFLLFRITLVGKDERLQLNSLYDRIFYFLRYVIKHKPMRKFNKNQVYPETVEKIELGRTLLFPFFYRILRFLLRDYEVIRVSQYWVEIMPKTTNKLNQLKYVVDKYQISLEDLYVFGDGGNDVEMLKYAKHSYAPVNALNEAKQAAHDECLASENNGVAMKIKAIFK